MRVGIDYRFLAGGAYQVRRGMGRFTQQQLREVLRVDPANEYIVCCPAGADMSLVHPDVLAAPNAAIRFLPAAVTRPGLGDDLERAELFQAWIEHSALDLFHATTPMLGSEPMLSTFDVCPLVATLYDLIPLVFPSQYLGGARDHDNYLRAVGLLTKAQRLIAISESARHDAFHYLGIPRDRIDVAYPIADPAFRNVDDETARARFAGYEPATGFPTGSRWR